MVLIITRICWNVLFYARFQGGGGGRFERASNDRKKRKGFQTYNPLPPEKIQKFMIS